MNNLAREQMARQQAQLDQIRAAADAWVFRPAPAPVDMAFSFCDPAQAQGSGRLLDPQTAEKIRARQETRQRALLLG